MSHSSELYYAHMEADRNEAADAYFKARPGFGELEKSIFRAGFERAYAKLWPLAIIQIDEKQRAGMETPAVTVGHFSRGEINPLYCKNCGGHYDRHLHTDESSTCPTANRAAEQQ